MPRAFFDMNVWINLARADKGNSATWAPVLKLVRNLVDSGDLNVYLTESNYHEVWHRRQERSRLEIGALMRELSDYKSISPLHAINKREVLNILSLDRGRAADFTAESLLGFGANHAFNSPYGRFKFKQWIQFDGQETVLGPEAEAPIGWDKLYSDRDHWEWLNLVGIQELFDGSGVDDRPQHRIGTKFAADQQTIQNLTLPKHDLMDALARDMIHDLLEIAREVCREQEWTEDSIRLPFGMATRPSEAAQECNQFFPSNDVWHSLRSQKHANPNLKWHQHDWTDLVGLSIAVPYLDIVATEKQWCHLLRLSGLLSRYNTVALSKPSEFVAYLSQ